MGWVDNNWSVAGQIDQALRNALFWLGCPAVAEVAQAGLQEERVVSFADQYLLGPSAQSR